MNDRLKKIIQELLDYSFEPIDYDFTLLTSGERRIIHSEEELLELKNWVKGTDHADSNQNREAPDATR